MRSPGWIDFNFSKESHVEVFYCCEVCWVNKSCGNDCGDCSGRPTASEALQAVESSGKGAWQFRTSCLNAEGKSIDAMTMAATEVTYKQLRRVLGDALTAVEKRLGYDTGRERGGLRMSKDFAVSCWRSTFEGDPCYYFTWSHIEHIFTRSK